LQDDMPLRLALLLALLRETALLLWLYGSSLLVGK
jgi:hypothetical protein